MARKSSRAIEIEVDEPDVDDIDSGSEEGESIEQGSYHRTLSKAGAAREALQAGITVPKQASVYIKQKHGIDISPQQFSAEKSRMKLRSGGVIPSGQHDPSTHSLEASGKKSAFPGQTDLLKALEIMKPLIDQLGVEKVKRMVDLLG